ncbi:MAG: DHH family phosphoesterase [Clostridiales bacterium]|nr:DHH family phosphoesterase [Clostridiales bacterium]
MELHDLLNYDKIIIQCHDNPDADALASGYALAWYFQNQNKDARFIYRGRNKIQKSNLMIMLSELEVPVSYEPDFDENPDLLITVDCQYGQRNVTSTEAKEVVIIDHHQVSDPVSNQSEIRSNIGSCSTIVWDMIRKEGIDVNANKKLSTALYYGLYTDTNHLAEVSHPLDRDMLDTLKVNKSLITKMSNSNISLAELKITGAAILNYQYFDSHRYLIIEAEQCDPNILGVISDFALETDAVDICLAFFVSSYEVKFSVRSCIKEVHADELASFLAENVGGGGGHIYKAGGSIRPEKLEETAQALFDRRMKEYFDKYQILYAKETTIDTSDMSIYEKLPMEVGTVKLSDVFPCQSLVDVRTLEGDVTITIEDDTYLMIGVEGEVYPIAKEKLERSYTHLGKPYSRKLEYQPTIKNIATGERKDVLSYADTVMSSGGGRIYARPLTRCVKLFTVWDEEKYYLGNVGDYIAVRADDPHDMYIIKQHLFPILYKKAE